MPNENAASELPDYTQNGDMGENLLRNSSLINTAEVPDSIALDETLGELPGSVFKDTTLKSVTLGPRTLSLEYGESLSRAISQLPVVGGTINLAAGTYVINTAVIGKSALKIIGENYLTTIIDFNNTAANLSFQGTSMYSTGTITSIASGVIVTGSGTLWLANVTTGEQFYIAQRWYKIASVDSDTQITLSEGYAGGATFPGAAYRVGSIIESVVLENLTLKNSTGIGIDFDDCRNVNLEQVQLVDCNIGFSMDNVSEISINTVTSVSHTSHGVTLTGCGFGDVESFSTPSNGGSGVVLNTCRTIPFQYCSSNSNTADGYNLTSCDTISITAEAVSNGSQGIELVSGNSDIFISQGVVESNTSDGVKLTASSDNCFISDCSIKSNGGYGVNIAVAGDDTNLIIGNNFASNTSGQVNNVGTGTLIRSNIGVVDN